MKRAGRIAALGGLLALGAAFLSVGIGKGQMTEVLSKAIRICLECIGIG